MKKNNFTLYSLCLLLLVLPNNAVAKDPFQPVDLSQCTLFLKQLEGWRVNAVLIHVSHRAAVISHTSLGVKKIALGETLSFIYGRVTQIELDYIEVSVLPPCPANRIILNVKGAL